MMTKYRTGSEELGDDHLGLPVPPGFIITTEACRYYLEQGSTPGGPRRGNRGPPGPAGIGDGPQARRSGRPAAGQRQVRGEVLHAGHDGHRPEHRPVRRVGAGPGQAGRQRAVRLGLLPAPDPDVRQDRPGHRRRALRARHRRGQEGQGRPQRPRPGRRRPAEPGRDVQGHRQGAGRPGLPAGPQGAAGPGHQGRVPLLELAPRHPVPPPGAHPHRPGHRRERGGDGLRQPGHGLGHRRRVHQGPGHRRPGRLR